MRVSLGRCGVRPPLHIPKAQGVVWWCGVAHPNRRVTYSSYSPRASAAQGGRGGGSKGGRGEAVQKGA